MRPSMPQGWAPARSRAGRVGVLALMALLFGVMPEVGFPGSALILLSAVALGLAWLQEGDLRSLGLVSPGPWALQLRWVVLGLLAFLVLAKGLVVPGVDRLLGRTRDLSRFEALRGQWRVAFGMLALIWTSAAWGEEVLFRGFLLGQWRGLFGDGPVARASGALASAALFGLVHAYQGLAGVLITALMGLLFAAMYLANGRRLWTNILVHGLFDTCSLLLITTGGDRGVEAWVRRIWG